MEIGKPVPRPICYKSREMLIGALMCKNVLVDEAGTILEEILGVNVVAASIDGEALRLANPALGSFESMGLVELLRTWRKAKKGKRNG